MRKIIFVIPSLSGGGAERVLVNILKYLDRSRFFSKVIVFEPKNDYEEDTPGDIEIICLNKKSRFDFFKLLLLLSKKLKEEKPDLVVSSLSYANYLTLLANRIFKLNFSIVITEQNYPDMEISTQRFSSLHKFLMKKTYSFASAVIAVSKGVKENLCENYGVNENKCFVIYNCVDFDNIREKLKENVNHLWFEERIPIIISCGRLSLQKNYPFLLRSFKKVLNLIDARLVILGKGELEEFLKKYTEELGIKERVLFLGFQRNPFKYIAKSTIFVLSSSFEGFGNVLLEAMACGVPVISTDCPFGPNEIIKNGENGILVPVNDEDALCNAIVKLLKDKELREKLVLNGLKTVQNFDVKNMVLNYEKIFEFVMDANFKNS
ncbi:MAG: glycosyltransferase [Endomicrobiia bacterium]